MSLPLDTAKLQMSDESSFGFFFIGVALLKWMCSARWWIERETHVANPLVLDIMANRFSGPIRFFSRPPNLSSTYLLGGHSSWVEGAPSR
jgi:hypothetical protein